MADFHRQPAVPTWRQPARSGMWQRTGPATARARESGRVATVAGCGFTDRQARFLVLVLEHSGVCLPRQYRAFAGIAHGRETHRFFAKLIAGGFALRLAENNASLRAKSHPPERAYRLGRRGLRDDATWWRRRTPGGSTTSSTSRGTGRWARRIIPTGGR